MGKLSLRLSALECSYESSLQASSDHEYFFTSLFDPDYLFTTLNYFLIPPQLLLLFHIWLSGGILRVGTVLSSLVVIGKVLVLEHSHWSHLIPGQRRELPDDRPNQLAGGEDLLDQAAAHRQVPPRLLSHRLLPHRLWGGQRSQLCQRLLRSLPPNILSDSHMVRQS